MALLPPYDFKQDPSWWAQNETQWWAMEEDWEYRPTEDRALMNMALRQWALGDGHYWELLSADEQALHLTELWLVGYLPRLNNAQARARWVQHTLYPHLSAMQILAIWSVIDEVLCAYAHEKLSLAGIMYELWGI